VYVPFAGHVLDPTKLPVVLIGTSPLQVAIGAKDCASARAVASLQSIVVSKAPTAVAQVAGIGSLMFTEI